MEVSVLTPGLVTSPCLVSVYLCTNMLGWPTPANLTECNLQCCITAVWTKPQTRLSSLKISIQTALSSLLSPEFEKGSLLTILLSPTTNQLSRAYPSLLVTRQDIFTNILINTCGKFYNFKPKLLIFEIKSQSEVLVLMGETPLPGPEWRPVI